MEKTQIKKLISKKWKEINLKLAIQQCKLQMNVTIAKLLSNDVTATPIIPW